MKEKPLVSKEYSISMEMFGNAFLDFQKKFTYPKNILMTCAFSLIGISYIPPLIRDPGSSVCILIIVVCIFLTAGIWLNSAMIRKNLMNSIEGIQGDRYSVQIHEDGISISTTEFGEAAGEDKEPVSEEKTPENSEEKAESTEEEDFFAETETLTPAGVVKTVIDFTEDNVKILEKKDYFIIYLVKRMFYVVPKNIFSEDELKVVTESFKKAKFTEERK
ncbi:MAG: YcxB family protein [Oscillospiraceae bacterium]|nr:YcxB family protein [Oscillospiraceae bacterium]